MPEIGLLPTAQSVSYSQPPGVPSPKNPDQAGATAPVQSTLMSVGVTSAVRTGALAPYVTVM